MKTLINIILTVVIAFILSLFLPWWSVMIAGFTMGAIVGLKKASSFFVPFLAIALLWVVNAWFLAQPNDFTLTKKIAVLLQLEGNTFLLFLITGVVGGIAAGIAGVFGNQCKQLISGKSRMKVEEEEKQYFVIDFDSTFTKVEALDILGEISLSNHPERNTRLQKIKDITDLGMAGEMSLRESLIARIQLLNGNRAHLPELISRLSKLVSKSIERNRVFFDEHPEDTFIISNGFKEFIVPVVTKFGIKADHVFANDMIFDEEGNIIDLNRNNVLSINGGKVKQIEALKLKGQINMIGDGYTDYEVRQAGMANNFYAYTENVEREPVKKHADHIAPSFDEILYHKK